MACITCSSPLFCMKSHKVPPFFLKPLKFRRSHTSSSRIKFKAGTVGSPIPLSLWHMCPEISPAQGSFSSRIWPMGLISSKALRHPPLGAGSCLCPEAILPTNLPLSGCMEPCLSWEREEQRQEVFIWIPSTEASLTLSLEPSLDFTGLSCRLCMSGPPRAVPALP